MQAGRNPFGHIDLRVNNMATALRFYGTLLPALGFTDESHGPEWKVFAATGEHPSVPYFAFIEEPEHVPNHNRIAFWVSSPDRVYELAQLVRTAGGHITDGPGLCPEYSADYCAVYLRTPVATVWRLSTEQGTSLLGSAMAALRRGLGYGHAAVGSQQKRASRVRRRSSAPAWSQSP